MNILINLLQAHIASKCPELPSPFVYLQYVRYPPKKLLGSGFSTPCTVFCLICTINSELTSCLIFTHPSELGLISADFSGRVRHPLDSRKLFVRAYSHMNIYMTCSVSTPRARLVTKRPNPLHIRKGVSKEPYIHSEESLTSLSVRVPSICQVRIFT